MVRKEKTFLARILSIFFCFCRFDAFSLSVEMFLWIFAWETFK